jgi:hypothetical protein
MTENSRDRWCISRVAALGTSSFHTKSTKVLRTGATRLCSGRHAKKSAFAEFSVLFGFRLFNNIGDETLGKTPSGERLGGGSKGITVPSVVLTQATVRRAKMAFSTYRLDVCSLASSD